MRYATPAFLAISFVALSSLNANGHELTEKQMKPWSALECQVGLWFKQDWNKHQEYIHPKLVVWNDDLPAPVSAADTMDYVKALLKYSDEVVAHCLIPVTVTVVDDIAIINCYLQVLTRKNGELLESTYQLHNTWKKEGEHWLLLATCNSTVTEGEPAE